jgi:PhzF family phenazine biosynthesis protein
MELAYRLLNVFTVAGHRLSGNPLCVFEDGRELETGQMQALARQLNLSETTFVLPATRPEATARVRIFTPDHEMPFAGHPTLGTAHVVRALAAAAPGVAVAAGAGASVSAEDRVVLEMAAGLVEVLAEADRWTLRAARSPATRAPAGTPDELSAMVGLPPGAVARPLWVDTGTEQLVLPVRTAADVAAAWPDPVLLSRQGRRGDGDRCMAYVWSEVAPGQVTARYFFLGGGAVLEDPATGSACANLGGWLLATGAALPLRRVVDQGRAVQRPSRLELEVTAERAILVTGQVVELGRGSLTL